MKRRKRHTRFVEINTSKAKMAGSKIVQCMYEQKSA